MVSPDFDITFIDATEAIIRFRVQNFSEMKGPCTSPPCYVLNIAWRIMLMPRVVRLDGARWSKRHLGYFLQCNVDKRSNKWSCYATADLKLLSVNPEFEPYKKTLRHVFDAKRNNFGFKFYMPWDEVLDTSNGFIEDDAITVELHLITEAPQNIGILYDWGDYKGKIFVPKVKWSDAYKSMVERNCLLQKERSSMIAREEEFVKAQELYDLINMNISTIGIERVANEATKKIGKKSKKKENRVA